MTRAAIDSAARSRLLLSGPVAGCGLLLVVFGLLGCAPGPADVPAPTGSSSPAPAPESAAPTFQPDGSAEDNLPVFAAVTAEVWASEERDAGRAYIDALVEAGFDKESMQVTADRTTVGNPAESIQFSVAWSDGQCLIGQTGPSTGEPETAVMPQLDGGRCLIGDTRPIDW